MYKEIKGGKNGGYAQSLPSWWFSMGMHETMLSPAEKDICQLLSLTCHISIHAFAQSTETSSVPSPRKATPEVAGIIMAATYMSRMKLFSVNLFLSPCAQ